VIDVGQKLGEYEIVSRLHAGGMATLFLGKRFGAAGFSKHVAIKVVHPHLASDEMFVRMFVDEALLSARIQHPNVVHVEELGEANGTYFLVMEYLHGCSLSQLLKTLRRENRTLALEAAVHIALALADGLQGAHEAKGASGEQLSVVHRDVSPQNVLLSYQGHIKLIDFGIAKARGQGDPSTSGILKGKIRYMSPEQARGQILDRRSDIYSLGVVLWEMLTMRRLFDADSELALLDQVRSPHIVPPSTFNRVVPFALDHVVMWALDPDPSRRPATAQELRRALADAVPAALSIDASQLAHFLAALMGEQRDAVPAGVEASSRPPRVDPQKATEVLAAMTTLALAVAVTPDSARASGDRAAVRAAAEPAPAAEREGARARRPRSGRGRWLALVAAIMIAGAAAVLLRPDLAAKLFDMGTPASSPPPRRVERVFVRALAPVATPPPPAAAPAPVTTAVDAGATTEPAATEPDHGPSASRAEPDREETAPRQQARREERTRRARPERRPRVATPAREERPRVRSQTGPRIYERFDE